MALTQIVLVGVVGRTRNLWKLWIWRAIQSFCYVPWWSMEKMIEALSWRLSENCIARISINLEYCHLIQDNATCPCSKPIIWQYWFGSRETQEVCSKLQHWWDRWKLKKVWVLWCGVPEGTTRTQRHLQMDKPNTMKKLPGGSALKSVQSPSYHILFGLHSDMFVIFMLSIWKTFSVNHLQFPAVFLPEKSWMRPVPRIAHGALAPRNCPCRARNLDLWDTQRFFRNWNRVFFDVAVACLSKLQLLQ